MDDLGETRRSMSLDGEWRFATDPLERGLSDGWYQPDHSLSAAIRVPGAWNAQDVEFDTPQQLAAWEERRKPADDEYRKLGWLGDQCEHERMYHSYPGPGWYQRSVVVPNSWKFDRTELLLEGIERSARIWIDGNQCGNITSQIVPSRVDVTPFIVAGSLITITIRVDARTNPAVDPWWGCKDTLDFVHVVWGGLYGSVSLVGTAETRVENMALAWHPETSTAVITARVDGNWDDHFSLEVTLSDRAGPIVSKTSPVSDATVEIEVPIADPLLWSPDSPYLYTLDVRLFRPEGMVDTRRARTGLRDLRTDGSEFMLNGVPFFARGYGDDAIFPEAIAPPTDIDTYRRRLTVAKTFGFNWVRLHSWVPPAALLDAADELGMFVQPELPIGYATHFPPDPSTYDTIRQGWTDLITTHGMHPSIPVWCMGNEQYKVMSYAQELYTIAKNLDSTRLVIDSDGVPLGARDRPTADFHVTQFGESTGIGWDGAKYAFEPIGKPVIAHEVGYFSSLPDPSQRDRFGKGLRPYWLMEAHDQVQRRGWQESYPDMLRVSQELVRVCLKVNTEAIRLSQLNGMSAWMIHDFPNTAEGIVDMFWEPKRVAADWFRQFNGPIVVLMRDLERSYLSGHVLQLKPMISCFETRLPQKMRVSYQLLIHGRIITELRATTTVSSPRHDIDPMNLVLPEVTAVTKSELVATASWPGGTSTNSWDIWVYPASAPETEAAVNVALGKQLRAFIEVDDLEPLLVASVWSGESRAWLSSGGRVLLLDPAGFLPSAASPYRPATWNGDGHHGIAFDATHPALASLASDGWADLDLYHVVEGAKVMTLPPAVDDRALLMRCLDELKGVSTRGVLAEFVDRGGRLLVSGLNFAAALERGDAAGRFLLDNLIRYTSDEEFRPAVGLRPS